MGEPLEFTGIPVHDVYNKFNNTYRIYALENQSDSSLELNDFGNVTIKGNMQELVLNNTYHIKANRVEDDKYGVSYDVENIYMVKPQNDEEVRNFLSNILTRMQVETVMRNYPNIIELVVDDETDKIDTNNLYNIGEYRLNIIIKKIQENFKYMELTLALFDYNLSHDDIVKLHNDFKGTKQVIESMDDNPYSTLCKLTGVGFQYADEKIMNARPEFAGSKVRLIEAIKYIIAKVNNNGNSIITEQSLIESLGNIDYKLSLMWEEYNNDLGEDIIFNEHGITSKDMYDKELYIYEKLLAANDNCREWDVELEDYRELGGDIKLTNEQLTSLSNLCEYNFSFLTSPAGCGKSTATKAMTNYLKNNSISFWLAAPTGRASEILSSKTGEDAKTIHRMLKYHPKYGFRLKKIECDVLILDEVSMVDIELMYNILIRIDFSRTKLIFVADPAQLPSVAVGNVLHDLLSKDIFPTTRLTKVFRYKNGGLAKIATDTRANKKWLSQNETDIQVYGDNKDYVFYPYDKDDCLETAYQVYLHMLDKYSIEDVILLTSYRVGEYGTNIINKVLKELYNPMTDDKKELSNKYKTFRVGDRVMQIRNNYEAYKVDYHDIDFEWMNEYEFEQMFSETEIFNGKIGTVVDIFEGYLIVNFDDDFIVYNSGDDFQDIELGYAITTHKSQGSEICHLILLTPSSHSYMLNRNLLYTAQTRAKERVIHIGDPYTVYHSMDKSAQEDRMTNLRFIGQNKED